MHTKICINKKKTDEKIISKFKIDEMLLMENAAHSLAENIKKYIKKSSKIIFLIGPGNNGADGMACARILKSVIKNEIRLIFLCEETFLKSALAKKHFEILKKLNVTTFLFNDFKILEKLKHKDIVVDCILGSGAEIRNLESNLNLDSKDLKNFTFNTKSNLISKDIVHAFAKCKAFKIACDIPTLAQLGIFNANLTLCIGALGLDHFKKEVVGRVKIIDLGISSKKYQECFQSNFYLLNPKILKSIFKRSEKVNKGSFGEGYILSGKIKGASLISAKAALNSGCGKAIIFEDFLEATHKNSMLEHKLESKAQQNCNLAMDKEIIYSRDIKNLKNAKVLGIGMGLGFNRMEMNKLFNFLDNFKGNLVLDADIFHSEELAEFLQKERKNIVLTPHPKELFSLLNNLAKYLDFLDLFNTFEKMMQNLFLISHKLSKRFKEIVFLIKDYNMIIAQNGEVFINPYASNNLAKGGSGDALSGIIISFLAQGINPLQSAQISSLLLSLISKIALKKYAPFALTPDKIIKTLSKASITDIKLLQNEYSNNKFNFTN